jgi:hypothetical protein
MAVDLGEGGFVLNVRGVVFVVLFVVGAAGGGQIQTWRYERQLADQARFQAETLKELAFASSSQQRSEFDKRYAVEQRLQINDQTHQRAFTDAKQRQARPTDRLATADLRLSVILAQPPFAGGNAVSAATGTGGVVYGGERAELERAFAQRIVRITEEGDEGLIALAACQAYVRATSDIPDSIAIPPLAPLRVLPEVRTQADAASTAVQ